MMSTKRKEIRGHTGATVGNVTVEVIYVTCTPLEDFICFRDPAECLLIRVTLSPLCFE